MRQRFTEAPWLGIMASSITTFTFAEVDELRALAAPTSPYHAQRDKPRPGKRYRTDPVRPQKSRLKSGGEPGVVHLTLGRSSNGGDGERGEAKANKKPTSQVRYVATRKPQQ